MDLARRKLGLLLSTAPEHPNLATALALARRVWQRCG